MQKKCKIYEQVTTYLLNQFSASICLASIFVNILQISLEIRL